MMLHSTALKLIKNPRLSSTAPRGKIIQCFLNTDLRCQHAGLAELAKKKSKIDVTNLHDGQYVVFLNARKDRCKVYASRNIIAYMRSPMGSRIDLAAISEIPKAFRGPGDLSYDRTLELSFERRLKRVR